MTTAIVFAVLFGITLVAMVVQSVFFAKTLAAEHQRRVDVVGILQRERDEAKREGDKARSDLAKEREYCRMLEDECETKTREKNRAVSLMGDALAYVLDRLRFGKRDHEAANQRFRELSSGILTVLRDNHRSFIAAVSPVVCAIEKPGGGKFDWDKMAVVGRHREFPAIRVSFSYAISDETPRELVANEIGERVAREVTIAVLTRAGETK